MNGIVTYGFGDINNPGYIVVYGFSTVIPFITFSFNVDICQSKAFQVDVCQSKNITLEI